MGAEVKEYAWIKGLIPDFMAPAGNSFFISPLGINLPDPSGIPVTGHSNKDVRIEISK
jgi:hypothetical protein